MAKLIAVLLAVGIPLLWGVGMYYLFERWREGNSSRGKKKKISGKDGDTAEGRPAEDRPRERSDD